MITIVLTNRNRDTRIIKNCLDSLQNQSDSDFEWFFIDYGSNESCLNELNALILHYPKIKFISCPTSGQLWSKCRAINIALQKATQQYFVVGDIDLIFHPNYIQILKSLANPKHVYYFQYGFLSENESLKKQKFDDFKVDFTGNNEVTGNTMFPSEALKSINGFDEFYQGWGAEDTDAHIRMRTSGHTIVFFEESVLVKHQWHPKSYRSVRSYQPFHSDLERINQVYMMQTESTKRTIVNQNLKWGMLTNLEEYNELEKPAITLNIENSVIMIKGFLAQLKNFSGEVIHFNFNKVKKETIIKNKIKKLFYRKYLAFYEMDEVNNILLEELIKNYRNCPYRYAFNRQIQQITVTINFIK